VRAGPFTISIGAASKQVPQVNGNLAKVFASRNGTLSSIDRMLIRESGLWESLEKIQRYIRSFRFQDSIQYYRSPITYTI